MRNGTQVPARELWLIAGAWADPAGLYELGLPEGVGPRTDNALRCFPKAGGTTGDLTRAGLDAESVAAALRLLHEVPTFASAVERFEAEAVTAGDLLPTPRPAALLFDTTFPPLEFAIDPYFPRAEVTELVGAHGIFKSTAALGADLCVATGRPWGPAPATQGRAAFITMEDSERTLARRVRAWLDGVPAGREREEAEADIRRNFVYLAREHASGLAMTSTDRTSTTLRPHVVEHLTATLAGVSKVTLETASRLHDGPEMNEGLAVFASAVERVAIGTGAAVCVVRHVSKQVARDGSTDSYSGRGGGSFSDAARSVLVMAREKDDGDGLAPVKLVHAKSTHTAPGQPITWRPVATEGGVYLHALSSQEAIRDDARRLLEFMAGKPDGITQTDLHNSSPGGLRRHAAKAALDQLLQAGQVVGKEETRGKTKQRTMVYRVRT